MALKTGQILSGFSPIFYFKASMYANITVWDTEEWGTGGGAQGEGWRRKELSLNEIN